MKNMKKLFALLLALVMVMGMAINVSAAEQNVDVQTDGHSYNVYQIFLGTQTAADATLTDIAWGSGVNGAALLAELKSDAKTSAYFGNCETVSDVAGVLASNGSHTVADAFANIAVKHLTDPVKKDGTAIVINDATTKVDLEPGYYLFLDITEDLGKEHAHNPALLQVTKAGNITIRRKATVPTIEKAISDGTEKGIQLVTAMIGSTVDFQLTTSLASGMGHYDEYEYIIHDDIPVGMVADASSVKVYVMINGDFATKQEVTGGFTVSTATTTCDVFKTTPASTAGHSDDTCNLEVIFADLIKPITLAGGTSYTVDAADEFFVTYEATVTPDAETWMLEEVVILHNDALLEFPNDPNWNPDDPSNEGKEPPTGITPESDAEVYLTKVTVEKVDDSKNPLKGAEFKLEGSGVKPVITYGKQFVETTTFEAGETKYWLLTDGTYTDTDPATPNIDTSVYDPAGKTYALRDYEIESTEATDAITVSVGEDGKITFAGLGVGTYYLTETKAPAGYNLLKDKIRLVITFNSETKTFAYDWRVEGETTAISSTMAIQVVNHAGNILPETGGMGTTMFYVMGGVMALAAIVLMITKKRMNAQA